MKSIKAFAFLLLISTVTLTSCMKEYSAENGGSTGMATGTLKAGGSGECLPSSVQGTYIAGAVTTTANYINVDVDITALGSYAITTNVVNGYSFSATGVATSLGVQTIRLNANGIPTASGANTFTVTFNGSQCALVVDVFPAGTGNATFTLGGNPGDCTPVALAGTYTQGTAMTSANTVTIQLTVSVAGLYNLSTTAVNGVSFSGTGMLAMGTHSVNLTASGTPPAGAAQTHTYTINGGGNCTFDVDFAAGTPPPTGNTWSFKVGTTTYSGTTDVCDVTGAPAPTVDIFGSNTNGASFDLFLAATTGSLGVGTYSGTPTAGKVCLSFEFTEGTTEYVFFSSLGGNISTNVSTYNTTTKIIEGTFSGTAKTGSDPSAGTIVNITEGKFKAALP